MKFGIKPESKKEEIAKDEAAIETDKLDTKGPEEDDEENADSEENLKDTPANKEERDLELENARLKGENDALKTLRSTSSQNSEQQKKQNDEQLKAKVLADADALSDEDFQTAYGMSKWKATSAIHKHDADLSRVQNEEVTAKTEAREELSDKYGKSFLKYKSQVLDSIQDASPEVRRDPKRLSRFMETQYLALVNAERESGKVKNDKDDKMDNKRIVRDFEPPKPRSEERTKDKEEDFESEEDRELAGNFGIGSYKDLKQAQGDFIDIDMGDGVICTHDGHGGAKFVKKVA